MEQLVESLVSKGWTPAWATGFVALATCVAAYLVGRLLRALARYPIARRLSENSPWRSAAARWRLRQRASLIVAAVLAWYLLPPLFETWPRALGLMRLLLGAVLVLSVAYTLSAFIGALAQVQQERREPGQHLPYKALEQGLRVMLWTYTTVALLSVVSGKDVPTVLAGLTAIGALLVYVFRDLILGWSAGVQLASNDLVREGEWITVPGHDVDGMVEDIALTTVTVRNWDKTRSAIPTHALVSEGFRNWRGMYESGGRRIKRALAIDLDTIRFPDESLLARLGESPPMADLVAQARKGASEPLFHGRLTNLGLYRGWLQAFLEAHPKVHEGMTTLVRELEPRGRGLPIEIYVFSNDQRWAEYEALQAEILDQAVAMLPAFGLRAFQEATSDGADLFTRRIAAAGAS